MWMTLVAGFRWFGKGFHFNCKEKAWQELHERAFHLVRELDMFRYEVFVDGIQPR